MRERVVNAYAPVVFRRAELREHGMSGRQIATAVRNGILCRIRRDRYADPSTNDDVIEAVRIGGRLSCLSLLRTFGVFVHHCDRLHVQVAQGASRLRMPLSSRTRVHWYTGGGERSLHAASVFDAVREGIRCQQPRAALATLDSVLHHGVMTRRQLEEVFAELPSRYRSLLALVDPSAESGPETYMRLILRSLGVRFETQMLLAGVGRVDFVVEGWLIIECDSKEFHEGWDKQVEDRRRDMAAAELGYVTLRPLASEIMDAPDQVRRSLVTAISVLGTNLAAASRSQLLTD